MRPAGQMPGCPGRLVAAVKVVIGTAAGARFFGITRSETMGAVPTFGTLFLGQPKDALLLALSPDGTVEMTILSIAVGTEVTFVVTCQVSRVMVVYTLAPLLFSLYRRRGLIPPADDSSNPRDSWCSFIWR